MKSIAAAILVAFLANGQAPPAAPQTTAAPETTKAAAPATTLLAAETTLAAAVPATTLSVAPETTAAPQTTAAQTTLAPQTTAAPPQTTAAGPKNPPAVLPPLIPMDPGAFTCNGIECVNRVINVVPGQGWSFKCAGNCAGATINIDVGLDPLHPGMMVDYIDAITCSEPMSCVGLTINIMNTNQGGPGMVMPVELNDLRCEKEYSCTGLIINAYQGVHIFNTNFDCSHDVACMGCIVRDAMKLEACNANQNPNGQLMMPWEIPGTGQLPQGPYRPAHQNPMLPAYTPKNPAPPAGLMPGQPLPQQPAQPQQPAPQQQPQYPQYPPYGYPYYPQQPYPYGYPYPYHV